MTGPRQILLNILAGSFYLGYSSQEMGLLGHKSRSKGF